MDIIFKLVLIILDAQDFDLFAFWFLYIKKKKTNLVQAILSWKLKNL